MIAEDRYLAILRFLNQKGSATVAELSHEVNASEATIRRDLIILDEQGRLNKVHGGATSITEEYISGERDVVTKLRMNMTEKESIARYAASLIYDDDFVFVDAGTTTMLMIEYIGNTKASFVTTGIAHARRMVEKGLKAFVVGGMLKIGTEAIVGGQAVLGLSTYNFTKAFIGSNGISIKQGYTTPDTEEALVKAKAMEQSHISYILADSSKFGKVSAVSFAPIGKACIITDKLTDESFSSYTVIKEV